MSNVFLIFSLIYTKLLEPYLNKVETCLLHTDMCFDADNYLLGDAQLNLSAREFRGTKNVWRFTTEFLPAFRWVENHSESSSVDKGVDSNTESVDCRDFHCWLPVIIENFRFANKGTAGEISSSLTVAPNALGYCSERRWIQGRIRRNRGAAHTSWARQASTHQ